jgi:hypothetical protein
MNCLDDHLHKFILNNNTNINHYIVLDVDKNSSLEEIRKSYLKLSKMYHPDKCKDIHATELFKLISNSYLVLVSQNQNDIDTEMTIEKALDLFFQNIINDTNTNLYTKMILKPKELSLDETITIGYSFYKLFINKYG